jgi:hypothetical protein
MYIKLIAVSAESTAKPRVLSLDDVNISGSINGQTYKQPISLGPSCKTKPTKEKETTSTNCCAS